MKKLEPVQERIWDAVFREVILQLPKNTFFGAASIYRIHEKAGQPDEEIMDIIHSAMLRLEWATRPDGCEFTICPGTRNRTIIAAWVERN